MEQKQKGGRWERNREREREREREEEGGVNEVAARQDLRGNANSAGSLIHRGLYQNLITSEAKATAKEER